MRPSLLPLLSLTSCLLALPALAEELKPDPTTDLEVRQPFDDTKGTLTLALENDIFAGADDGYTNGFRASWLSPENAMPLWLEKTARWLPIWPDSAQQRYGVDFGQNMYAPEDLGARGLIADDRPYAAWLYGSLSLVADSGDQLDTLQLTLGMVGPSALGEPIQDAVHYAVGSPDPRGWDNQLRDEAGVILTYERKWRGLYQFSPFGLGVDATPFVGGSVGNIYTHASTGAMFRIGYDLPADYGPPLIRPSMPGSDFFLPTRDIGWYLFTGVEGRAVARNIFLDGNSFRDSHSVDKEMLVGSLQMGAALTIEHYRLAYTHVWRTREFEEQDTPDQYGAVTLSVRF